MPNDGRDASVAAGAGSIPPLPSRMRSTMAGRDVWPAAASAGRLVGILLTIAAAVVSLVCLQRGLDSGGGIRYVWLGMAAAALAIGVALGYLLYGLSTLRYVFAGETLVIQWLRQQQVVPLVDIRDIVYAPRQPAPASGWEPFWPGYHVCTTRTRDGVWHTVATLAPQHRIRLLTRAGIVAISPERPVLFLLELDRRIALVDGVQATAGASAAPRVGSRGAAVAPAQPSTGRGAPPAWVRLYRELFLERLLGDHVASSLIAAGVAIPVLMSVWLFSQYEGLPDSIALHWDADGQVDRAGSPRELWSLPLGALLLLIVNTSLATLAIAVDRVLARLLTAVTPVVQVLAFIALLRLAT